MQVVYNLKHIRHLIGTNSGDGFVRFTGNNALQCQPAVFHDVVNRGNSLETVMAELAVLVGLETCLTANIVIHGRSRQDFKLVDDASDARNVPGGSRLVSRRVDAPSLKGSPFHSHPVGSSHCRRRHAGEALPAP